MSTTPPRSASLDVMNDSLSLREIKNKDREFLFEVYASTRADEMALLDWDDAEQGAFLRMQFDAQHKYYQEQFPDASYQIVLLRGEPIGRLYVDRRREEIRILDIALLPAHRNRGLGSILMQTILAESQATQLPVRIHVEQHNPALRLYQRLGFIHLSDRSIYQLMEWRPEASGVG
jgi:ribosomal protein S18 acetylase RimI-like enzyme